MNNIQEKDLSTALQQQFTSSEIRISMQGNNAQIEIISDIFADKKKVVRQQMVYKSISSFIADGSLHAVTITAITADEATERQN